MSRLLERESQLDTLRRTRVAPVQVPPAASASTDASATAPTQPPVVLTGPAAMPAQPPHPTRHRTRIWVRLPKLALAGLAAFWLSRPFVEPLMPLELPAPDPVASTVTIEVVDVLPPAAPEIQPQVQSVERSAAAPVEDEDLMPDIVEFEELQPADLATSDAPDGASPDTASMPAEPAPPAPDAAAPTSMEPAQDPHPAPVVIDVMDMAMRRASAVYASMEAALQDAAALSRSREARQPRRWWKFGGS